MAQTSEQKKSVGLQLLTGLNYNANREWVQNMTEYHNHMVQNAVVSYPVYPLVLGKRVRFEAHMASGKLGIAFETEGKANLCVTLTPSEFLLMKEHEDKLMAFIKAVQTKNKLPFEGPMDREKDGWKSKTVLLDGFSVKMTWKDEMSQVVLVKGDKKFTMSAGGFTRYHDFVSNKITNAVRMWDAMLAVSANLRPSLMADYNQLECMEIDAILPRDPVEIEAMFP
jgi:hypothetical protein